MQLSSLTGTQSLVKCVCASLTWKHTLSLCGAHESPAEEDKDRSAALDARVDAQDRGGSSEGRQHSVCQFISESGKYSAIGFLF